MQSEVQLTIDLQPTPRVHHETLSRSPVIVACTPDRTPYPLFAPLRPASHPYTSGGHFRQKSRLSTFCRCPPNDVVFGRRSMPPKTSRDRITLDSALGRSSVASGGCPFPPCLIACSPSGYQSPSHTTHAAARPRTNALTLNPSPRERFPASYSVAGYSRGLSLSLIAALRLRLPSLRGSCSLRSHSPRHAPTPRAERENLHRLLICAGIGYVRSRVGRKKASTACRDFCTHDFFNC